MMNSLCLLFAALVGFFIVTSTATNETDYCSTPEFDEPDGGPQINPCTDELTLQQGTNYTLKCRADTLIVFIRQELAEEKYGNFMTIQRSYFDENSDYPYETHLELINIDRYAIGYYACIRTSNYSVDINSTIKGLAAEPNNTESATYIYIYVNGTDSLYAPMREIVLGVKDDYVVECKPSTPDVEVKILLPDIAENTPIKRYSPKIGFIFDSKTLDEFTAPHTPIMCDFTNQYKQDANGVIFVKRQMEQPGPTINGNYHEFLEGETFSINCSVNYVPNLAYVLSWELPPHINNTAKHYSNQLSVTEGLLYHNIVIANATREHAMVYKCVAKTHCGPKESTFEKIFLEHAILNLSTKSLNETTWTVFIESKQPSIKRSIKVVSYPRAQFSLYRNDVAIKGEHGQAFLTENIPDPNNIIEMEVSIKVNQSTGVEDSGNYTVVANNGHLTKNITFEILFKNAPKMLSGDIIKYCDIDRRVSLQCEVTGYPMPTVKWTAGVKEMKSTEVKAVTIYKSKAILDVKCNQNINITCDAINGIPSKKAAKRTVVLRVNEMPGGFGIKKATKTEDGVMWFAEEENVSIKCLASIHDFSNVTWKLNGEKISTVNHTENQFSRIAILNKMSISTSDVGSYECVGERINGSLERQTIDIKVDKLTSPKVTISTDTSGNVEKYQPVNIYCNATGVPRPTISWLKDDKEFPPEKNDTNIQIYNDTVDRKTVNSKIYIKRMNEENSGTFKCVARNVKDEGIKQVELVLKAIAITKYVIPIVTIIVLLIAIVVFLIVKLKKDKAKRQKLRAELAAAGLLYFKKDQSKYLNPDLFIDEQADLLPYDERFEFPPEKLTLGKQLGAGAFGVVYKAEARGIINAEETTPVAVKMVKRTADNMFIKALATELKIMVHLGKHVNIVNLLGACTKNVGKRELSVIVEYCKFGNIHNYMQKHREVFIDLFSDNNKEKSFGKVNRGYDSSGSTGLQSDYGTANTQDTDHTFLTNNTNRTSRKNLPRQPPELPKVSEGYIQPEWRSNYESDYSYDGRSPRPLTSRDLLCWAFQIARGMEYLAKRKILHGDLAARNILLAEDNVVKICDFGLARSIYKNDEYKKKENSLLPVKWLALECITDRIFSTQSDVWSYGIVLWELFTLAKTPYPNMDPCHLLPFLKEGRRLEKPPFADDRIYDVMKRCWEEKPTMRPSFTQLQDELGTFLEENVRNHYMDLNNSYMEFNEQGRQEDYLAMVNAPDYNNMVAPSPHQYVNEDPRRFFPPSPTKVGEDGYLQMTPRSGDIFSPKPNAGTRFDFDARKLNVRPSEATSVGSELTPMLTINNLPRSSSDSDHEGAVYPFPNGCRTINEESVDDVFLTEQNNDTSAQNTKNAQNTAVTNPTYITFDLDNEKKPKDVISYVNIKPNGLVK